MKKLLALLLSAILLVGMFGTAAFAESAEVDRNIVGDGKNVIKIAFRGEYFPRDLLQEQFQAFFDKTGISIEYNFVAAGNWADFFAKLETMIIGGYVPDVVDVAVEGFEYFRVNDMLVPLNEYAEKYPEWAALVNNNAQLSAPLTVDGKTYGYTAEYNNVCMHINTALLKEVGLEIPSDTWTREDFLEYCKALTFTREDGTQVFGTNLYTNYFGISGWLRSNGASVLNEDMTECVINSPEAIEIIQFLYDLKYVHKVAPIDNGNFVAGQAAMQQSGRWALSGYKTAELDTIALQVMPSNKENRQHVVGGSLFGIIEMSEKKDEAYQLLCHMVSEESQRKLLFNASGIPTNEVVMKELTVDAEWPTNARVFYDTCAEAAWVECPPAYNEISSCVNRYIGLILSDEMPVVEALNACKDEVDLLLLEFEY